MSETLRALAFLTGSLLRRLAREGMVVRSLVFPTALVIGTLMATLAVMAAIRTPQTVAVIPTDPVAEAAEEAGFVVVRTEDPQLALDRGAVWASIVDEKITATSDDLGLQQLEALVREARGSAWRPASNPQRPSNVESQPLALRIARLLAVLFTLYGVVFGAGMVARDRGDGTLESELALPVPRWTHATARFIAGSLGLAVFFAGGVALVDAMLDIEAPLIILGHGAAAAAGATAIGIASAGRSTIKSGFSTTLAVSMSAVSVLGSMGLSSEATHFLPIASLSATGSPVVPLLVSLVLGAACSAWFGRAQS
ncbi:MAG: ABC transporter permease subunit [Proteobacteria bacterium]|nr:ABC transporter permease subunit [Pseudomonadota bacterium]